MTSSTLNLLIFNIQYPASNQTHRQKRVFPRKEGTKRTSRQNSSTGDQENELTGPRQQQQRHCEQYVQEIDRQY